MNLNSIIRYIINTLIIISVLYVNSRLYIYFREMANKEFNYSLLYWYDFLPTLIGLAFAIIFSIKLKFSSYQNFAEICKFSFRKFALYALPSIVILFMFTHGGYLYIVSKLPLTPKLFHIYSDLVQNNLTKTTLTLISGYMFLKSFIVESTVKNNVSKEII